MTYRQKAPNAFAAVRRGPIELQFFSMEDYEPANSNSTCYVLTGDVDRLYADMSYGVRQFVMTDPGGNMIRIGQPITTTVEPRAPASRTRLLPIAGY